MNRIRTFISGFVLAALVTCSACLTGGGSTGGPSGGAIPGAMEATAPGGILPEAPPSGAVAASGGGDTAMPPRADLGDIMPDVNPLVADWRISYLPSPSARVPGSPYASEPTPLSFEGKTEVNGRFLVELGEAEYGCSEASCWRWSIAPENRFVRLKLTRGVADKTVAYYQDFRIGAIQPDGSNLQVTVTPVKDGDLLYFAYTGSEAEPSGYSSALTELTDDVQTFANTVYLGYFKVNTATASYRRNFDLHGPLNDLHRPMDDLLFK